MFLRKGETIIYDISNLFVLDFSRGNLIFKYTPSSDYLFRCSLQHQNNMKLASFLWLEDRLEVLAARILPKEALRIIRK